MHTYIKRLTACSSTSSREVTVQNLLSASLLSSSTSSTPFKPFFLSAPRPLAEFILAVFVFVWFARRLAGTGGIKEACISSRSTPSCRAISGSWIMWKTTSTGVSSSRGGSNSEIPSLRPINRTWHTKVWVCMGVFWVCVSVFWVFGCVLGVCECVLGVRGCVLRILYVFVFVLHAASSLGAKLSASDISLWLWHGHSMPTMKMCICIHKRKMRKMTWYAHDQVLWAWSRALRMITCFGHDHVLWAWPRALRMITCYEHDHVLWAKCTFLKTTDKWIHACMHTCKNWQGCIHTDINASKTHTYTLPHANSPSRLSFINQYVCVCI